MALVVITHYTLCNGSNTLPKEVHDMDFLFDSHLIREVPKRSQRFFTPPRCYCLFKNPLLECSPVQQLLHEVVRASSSVHDGQLSLSLVHHHLTGVSSA